MDELKGAEDFNFFYTFDACVFASGLSLTNPRTARFND